MKERGPGKKNTSYFHVGPCKSYTFEVRVKQKLLNLTKTKTEFQASSTTDETR